MKKYDSYKDSGVEWIGEIPKHWILTIIKFKYHIGRGRVISNEDLVEDGIYPVYSSQTLNNGCLGYINSYDFEEKLITWTTDGANAGTVFLRDGKFNCTNVCGTLKAKSDDIIPEFDYYFLQYATQFYKRPDTNGAKIMNNEMAVILSLQLPQNEQIVIANYLDQKTSQIDQLIAKKEQLIQLLEEERVAVINQAVTKGLDANVPMKDSGIEWLGEIPEHWEVKKLKYLVDCNRNTLSENSEPTQIINYIEIGDVNFEKGIIGYTEYSFEKAPSRARRIVHSEDVIVSTVRTYLKAIATVKEEFDGFIASTGFAVLTPKEIYFKLLSYLVLTNGFIDSVISLSKGVSYPSITSQDLLNISICLPNNIEEQHSISCHLDAKISEINKIIAKSRQEIELLKEYKTALISEVVTGKVDVRNEKLN